MMSIISLTNIAQAPPLRLGERLRVGEPAREWATPHDGSADGHFVWSSSEVNKMITRTDPVIITLIRLLRLATYFAFAACPERTGAN